MSNLMDTRLILSKEMGKSVAYSNEKAASFITLWQLWNAKQKRTKTNKQKKHHGPLVNSGAKMKHIWSSFLLLLYM